MLKCVCLVTPLSLPRLVLVRSLSTPPSHLPMCHHATLPLSPPPTLVRFPPAVKSPTLPPPPPRPPPPPALSFPSSKTPLQWFMLSSVSRWPGLCHPCSVTPIAALRWLTTKKSRTSWGCETSSARTRFCRMPWISGTQWDDDDEEGHPIHSFSAIQLCPPLFNALNT